VEFHPVHRNVIGGICLDVNPLILFHHINLPFVWMAYRDRRGDVIHRNLDARLFVISAILDDGELERVKPFEGAYIPEIKWAILHLMVFISTYPTPSRWIQPLPVFEAIEFEVPRFGVSYYDNAF
jgi:hypothetical protein